MAWITLLKAVPWTNVIASAPAIADSAKRLWNTASKKPDANPDKPPQTPPFRPQGPTELIELAQRIDTLETADKNLQGLMQDSSLLLKALANQNTELIARVQLNQRLMVWNFVLSAILCLALVAGALIVFTK
jgi:hypothetical protein